MSELPQGNKANWDRTMSRTELLKILNSALYEEPTGESVLGDISASNPSKYGIYKNRHVIGRDERINQGVYLGAGEREEIVVNDKREKTADIYDGIYNKLLDKVRARQDSQQAEGVNSNFKNGILDEVFEVVLESMKYDDEFANKAANQYRNQKVDLSLFILEGKGVCRHQALLAGYLLERLKDNGLISGDVSIDRNSVPGVGAHSWVRYVSGTSGKIYILDPAQQFAGLLKDAPGDWPYQRPEEM
ncbi:hypothetical protein EXS53_01545 [Patescibacteria group bacterium]|nr:hypothetical protein [Patescibacteria group bacterium]